LQPFARLWGRMIAGLTPWRRARGCGLVLPRPRTSGTWSDTWRSPNDRLSEISSEIRRRGYVVRAGGSYDRWDLEIRGGIGAVTRIQMLAEEHGGGGQYLRIRSWQSYSRVALLSLTFFLVLTTIAALDQLWLIVAVLGFVATLIALQIGREAASSAAAARVALQHAMQGGTRTLPSGNDGRHVVAARTSPKDVEPAQSDTTDDSEIDDDDSSDSERETEPGPVRRRWGWRKSEPESRQVLKRILPYARPHWRLAIATIGITILGALGAIAAPWPLKFLIDSVLGDEPLPPILDPARFHCR
jgi:hypothetical protein